MKPCFSRYSRRRTARLPHRTAHLRTRQSSHLALAKVSFDTEKTSTWTQLCKNSMVRWRAADAAVTLVTWCVCLHTLDDLGVYVQGPSDFCASRRKTCHAGNRRWSSSRKTMVSYFFEFSSWINLFSAVVEAIFYADEILHDSDLSYIL